MADNYFPTRPWPNLEGSNPEDAGLRPHLFTHRNLPECLLVIAEAKAKPLCSPMADSSSDEDERPVRAAPTSFLSGPELLPSLIIDDSEAAPVRQRSQGRGWARAGGGLGERGWERP